MFSVSARVPSGSAAFRIGVTIVDMRFRLAEKLVLFRT
jgi:hypothetical protein